MSNIFKFLLSVEDTIYDLLLAIFFVPKTLWQISLYPGWIYQYVSSETSKDEKVRFDDFVNPLLLFVALVVLPFGCFAFSPLQSLINAFPKLQIFFEASWELKMLCISIYMLALPLLISICIHLHKNIPLSKTHLKPTLYSQCYAFIPPQVFSLILCFLMVRGCEFTKSDFIFWLFTCLPVFWLVARITVIIKHQLTVDWFKAGMLAFAFYILSMILLILILYILFRVIQ